VLARARERLTVLRELAAFALTSKRWWLAPLLLVLGVLGLFAVVTQSSALAPFLYTLF
jgi:hypothetical protein